MRTYKFILVICAMVVLPPNCFGQASKTEHTQLYDTIKQLDSVFFTAYNTCDLKTQTDMLSEDLEFYHDMGGLSTSKKEVMAGIENNICGKVTRELVANSIEVTEIPRFGAVQLGMHKFYNNQEPNAISKPSRFVTVWKKTEDTWLMSRIISLHAN